MSSATFINDEHKILLDNYSADLRSLSSIGLDPSIRHGAALRVIASFDATRGISIHRVDRLAIWGKVNHEKLKQGVGLKSPTGDFVDLGCEIGRAICAIGSWDARVYIDWSPGAIFSSSNMKLASLLALAIGACSAQLLMNYEYIHPSKLRSALGVGPRELKAEVQTKGLRRLTPESRQDILRLKMSEDELDALVLALFPLFTI